MIGSLFWAKKGLKQKFWKEKLSNFLLFKKKYVLPAEKWKSTLRKLFSSSLLPWAAQTEEFVFQNATYRPTVYETGVTYLGI